MPEMGGIELNSLLLPAAVLVVGAGVTAPYGIQRCIADCTEVGLGVLLFRVGCLMAFLGYPCSCLKHPYAIMRGSPMSLQNAVGGKL